MKDQKYESVSQEPWKWEKTKEIKGRDKQRQVTTYREHIPKVV